MSDPQPVNPMESFNRRFARARGGKSEQTSASPKTEEHSEKKTEKKQNSTNDLSQLGELLENNEEQGEIEMPDNKITTEMRHELNALGMNDATINGLTYDDAEGILKDKDELSDTLDQITDAQKITDEMRQELNAMGMDNMIISGLTYNDAAGILRDKKEINEALDELNTLKITEGDERKTPPVGEHEDLHWIDEKVRDYNGMKEAGNADIKAITPDKAAGTFTAEVDNGIITYTSKNEATVSKGSSYKVFDTMMKEPSNTGKAVRIPAEASEEFKTNLFVAAVLNGHKVNGAEDLVLNEETLNKIGLNDEQKAKVLAALAKPEEKTEEKPTERTEEKPEERTPEPKPSAKVLEAIAKLEEPKAKLAELIDAGKVSAAITSNTVTKKSEIAFNFDAAKGGTQADADEANKLLTEALKTVDELRQKVIPDDKEAAQQAILDNYAIKSAQLGLIRSVYQPEPSEAVKAVDRIRAKKLGLTDEKVEIDVAKRDADGHIIYQTNKKGKPLYKRDDKGEIMYRYKRDKSGNLERDADGNPVFDKTKPILVAQTEKKEIETLADDKRTAYETKLSSAVLARIKAEHGGK